MAGSVTPLLDLIDASQSQKEVTANALFDAASPATMYARRAKTSAGFTWGYYGGTLLIDGGIVSVPNGTLTLSASIGHWIEADPATGAVSLNHTGFTAGRMPLYLVLTDSTSIIGYEDLRSAYTSASTAASNSLAAHIAAADPHPQYMTQAESDARYAAAAGAVSDGDKGDIVVSGSGATWSIDSGVLSTFGRTLIDDADAATARATLGLGTAATLAADTDTALTANSDARTPTQKAVKAYIDSIVTGGASDVMIFKGVIDCSTNPNYPAADAGNVYKVSAAGKIGGASGPNVEAGDTLYCITDGTASGTQAGVGAAWVISQVNIDGAVTGPAAATDSALALFNGTTGKTVKDSGVLLSTDGTFAGNSDALVPTQKAVKTYVASAVAAGGGGGTPGGSTTQIQFNDAGAFAGSASLTWDKTNNILYVGPASGAAKIQGAAPSSTTSAGTAVTIQGGSGGTSSGVGGDVTIKSGVGSGSSAQGSIKILGSDSGAGGGNGGSVTIKSGFSGNSGGAGADITIQCGTSYFGNAGTIYIGGGGGAGQVKVTGGNGVGTSGGAVTLQGGIGGTSGSGGSGLFAGGDGNWGGEATFRGGDCTTNQTGGGTATLRGGNSIQNTIGGSPAPGDVVIKGGNAGGNQNYAGGGAVSITGGQGGTSAGAGGNVSITGGAPQADNGGSVTIAGAAGVGTNKNGGSVTLKPGAATGTGAPGNVVLNGSGAALATTATGGFTCLPTCAGTPTGTPASVPAGCVAAVIDTTNSKLCLYIGGAWKSVTLT